MSDTVILKFVPYTTSINPSFWYKLTQIKLDIDKLIENRRHIWGWFTNVKQSHNLPFLEIDCTSFNLDFPGQNMFLPVHGFILNKNTVEQFKDCNKVELIESEGSHILQHFKIGTILEDPSLLNSFFILSFADLKKYHYYFWFSFPTPTLNVYLNESPKNIKESFNNEQTSNLLTAYCNISSLCQKSFFVVKKELDNKISILTLNLFVNEYNQTAEPYNFDDLYFAYCDPSVINHPGWPLRNFLAFLLYSCPKLQNMNINILSIRINFKHNEYSCNNSIIFNIKFPQISEKSVEKFLFEKREDNQSAWTGWQKNDRGKLGPRLVDMSADMDPVKLAENSVDLNLKLMKWRLLPDINLDILKETKFLLLGSGTLGCSVARNLLNSEGHIINIPMPGHSVGESLMAETRSNVDLLTQLISLHDVVFLLTDSRESRWLPTVLAAHFNKLVINAALGFETYLVMRHGSNSKLEVVETNKCENDFVKLIPGNDLGCYFCNDITAPGNSLRDRTLDQQCTVTRPGISSIAGALAVELTVSLLQHKNGAQAPAFYSSTSSSVQQDIDDSNECVLGLLPHSIRGFLSTFSHVLPATRRFQKCIACSNIVLNEYKQNGFEFLLQVFNSSKYLEDLTGLTQLHEETDAAEIWDICSSEDDLE